MRFAFSFSSNNFFACLSLRVLNRHQKTLYSLFFFIMEAESYMTRWLWNYFSSGGFEEAQFHLPHADYQKSWNQKGQFSSFPFLICIQWHIKQGQHITPGLLTEMLIELFFSNASFYKTLSQDISVSRYQKLRWRSTGSRKANKIKREYWKLYSFKSNVLCFQVGSVKELMRWLLCLVDSHIKVLFICTWETEDCVFV